MDKEAIVRGILEDLTTENITEFRMNNREATAKFSDGVTVTIPITANE